MGRQALDMAVFARKVANPWQDESACGRFAPFLMPLLRRAAADADAKALEVVAAWRGDVPGGWREACKEAGWGGMGWLGHSLEMP